MATTAEPAEDGKIRVTVDGPMTIYEAVDLKRELLAALEQAERIEIDLARVDEIDTAGLQLLLLARREASRTGKQVHLAAASQALLEVLGQYRLTTCFEEAAPSYRSGQ